MNKSLKGTALAVKELSFDLIASVCWTIGVRLFAVPNHIAPSGFNGITVIINYLTNLPIGSMALLMNIPFLAVCWKRIGHDFVIRTARVLVIYTLLVDFVFTSLLVYRGDGIIAAIFGGLFNGLGTGLVLRQGYSGGGTDLIIKLIRKSYPYFSTGELVLAVNGVIMCCAALVYGNIEAALYGLIMTFTAGRVMDMILNGADAAKSVMVVTYKPEEISKLIIERLNRSATIISGKGAYRGDDTFVLLCVVRKSEFFRLKKLIREADPMAFVVVNEANQILGNGFRAIDSSDA